ncbi:MAG: hypothetical protein EZS28_043057 [Streblomastix strix]|uniref:Uncharacterized protein n=1 Tax=Streblomastix strix TaxID=222440 RepID=A0A5J4TS86_9EUKA|nr:MAG: hypothetical protein EZS28_043057 [Streblomastix strix]
MDNFNREVRIRAEIDNNIAGIDMESEVNEQTQCNSNEDAVNMQCNSNDVTDNKQRKGNDDANNNNGNKIEQE